MSVAEAEIFFLNGDFLVETVEEIEELPIVNFFENPEFTSLLQFNPSPQIYDDSEIVYATSEYEMLMPDVFVSAEEAFGPPPYSEDRILDELEIVNSMYPAGNFEFCIDLLKNISTMYRCLAEYYIDRARYRLDILDEVSESLLDGDRCLHFYGMYLCAEERAMDCYENLY